MARDYIFLDQYIAEYRIAIASMRREGKLNIALAVLTRTDETTTALFSLMTRKKLYLWVAFVFQIHLHIHHVLGNLREVLFDELIDVHTGRDIGRGYRDLRCSGI